jgi:predicted O-methyltransferase YrrM
MSIAPPDEANVPPPSDPTELPRLRLTWPGMHGALRRHFSGWTGADVAFLLGSSDRPTLRPRTLVERSGRRRFVVTNHTRLRFLAASVYSVETLLGSHAVGAEIQTLWDLAEQVEQELRSSFSAEEIRVRATGGFPEVKEPLLYALVRRVRPAQVIETGVAQGISTTFILSALRRNDRGRLSSIDLPNRSPDGSLDPVSGVRDRTYVPPGRSSGWIVPRDLRERWDLSEGKAEQLLPTLQGAVEIFFHDSLHTPAHMRFEFEWALGHLVPGGVLVSDDIHWNEAFTEFLRRNAGRVRGVSTKYVGVAQRV